MVRAQSLAPLQVNFEFGIIYFLVFPNFLEGKPRKLRVMNSETERSIKSVGLVSQEKFSIMAYGVSSTLWIKSSY